ncbi:hypothetical protein ACIBCT_35400 [Streptosporangium sp. NPDC050855]|uniref:hypothetical protein n=1 Tax=Streptosporangium sp. NPDC050855 TaxID=3366194 RepID=UPI0037A841C9
MDAIDREHAIYAAETTSNCPKCDTSKFSIVPNSPRAFCEPCGYTWVLGSELYSCACAKFIGNNDQAIMHIRENGGCETCLGTGEATPMGGAHGHCTSCGGSGRGYNGIEETVTLTVTLRVHKNPSAEPALGVDDQPAEFIAKEFADRVRLALQDEIKEPVLERVLVGTLRQGSGSFTLYDGRVARVEVTANRVRVEDAAR